MSSSKSLLCSALEGKRLGELILQFEPTIQEKPKLFGRFERSVASTNGIIVGKAMLL